MTNGCGIQNYDFNAKKIITAIFAILHQKLMPNSCSKITLDQIEDFEKISPFYIWYGWHKIYAKEYIWHNSLTFA